jgi:WD40 repeat protein/predicted Ser/Thr protein kinase
MSTHTSSPGEQALAIFDQVADADAAERPSLLQELCGGDESLRHQVQRLLDADATSPDLFLEDANVLEYFGPSRPREEVGLFAGGSFAGYEVLGLIAEGGMGSVYRARQQHPEREVALKVLRPGLAREDLLRRFEREVAVLGKLQHKGIAAIHAAGVHEGVPYFAMEFVRGVPVTEHGEGLDRDGRVALVLAICAAVAHAHEQGVVHRDLKPANILVDGFGDPRVLDFGIARLTEGGGPQATLTTTPGQILGTLAYMSPEQAAGELEAVDGRADVYALGVILFELLAGRRPLEVEHRPVHDAIRVVCDVDPVLLGEVDPSLRGDLEVVVAKALEKEPGRRYASVAALSDDLLRVLDERPITARPPSTLYQVRKFARRHRALVGGVAATLITLVIGIVVSVDFALDEQRAHDESQVRLYRSSLAAALDAAHEGRVGVARAFLDEAPEARRGFAFEHARAQLDGSVAVLDGHWRPIAWHPDGDRLLLVGPEGIRLWTVGASGPERSWQLDVPVHYRQGGDLHREALALSEDGRLLAAASGETVQVWSVESRERLAEVTCADVVEDLVFLPGGNRLAVATGSQVRWLDGPTGLDLGTWDGFAHPVSLLNPSPDGRWLSAATGYDIGLWDLERGRSAHVLTVRDPAGEGSLLRTRFAPDAEQISVVGGQRSVSTFDLSTGRHVLEVVVPLERPLVHDYDPSTGDLLVSIATNGRVYRFDGDDGILLDEVLVSASQVPGLAVHGGTGRVALTRWEEVRLLEGAFDDGRVLPGHVGPVESPLFSPDGSRLAALSLSDQPAVRVWDLDDDVDRGARVLRGHTSWVYALAFSLDGAWLVTGGWDHTLRFWDLATGECFATLPVTSKVVYGAAFSADGLRLLVHAGGGTLLVDLTTGEVAASPSPFHPARQVDEQGGYDPRETHSLLGHDAPVHGRVTNVSGQDVGLWSPDGQLVMARRGGLPSPLEVLAPADDEKQRRVEGVALSGDGALVAASSRDGRVRLWDVLSGAPIAVLSGHTSWAMGPDFSPDGRRLAVGGQDGTIRLWDLSDHEPVAVLRGHDSYVYRVAFSPDGRTLASASGDATVRLWETRTAQERAERATAARARRDDARPRVVALFDELGDGAAVWQQLQEDAGLTPEMAVAARAELLVEALRRQR